MNDDATETLVHPHVRAELASGIAEALDRVLVRTEAAYAVANLLRDMEASWSAAGLDDHERALLRRAQGVVAMLNGSARTDPIYTRGLRELIALKQQLRGAEPVPA